MNSMLLSLFLAVILMVRLLPLSRATNVTVSIIAGILFIVFGISEYREKGWKALGIAGVGLLLIIFSFIPALNSGGAFVAVTIILSLIVIILTVLSEFIKPKKEEPKKEA